MSDILSTRSFGDPAILRHQTGNATSPVATVIVADAAFRLPNLSVGALISGVVTERAGRGAVVIRTDKGNLTIQSNVPLQEGSTVVLQLQSVGTQSRVVILSVNGQPIGSLDKAQQGQNQRIGAPGPSPQTEADRPIASPGGASDRPAALAGTSHQGKPESGPLTSPSVARGGLGGREVPTQRPTLANGLVLSARVLDVAPGAPTGSQVPELRSGDTLTVRILALGPPRIAHLEPSVPPEGPQSNWIKGTIAANGPGGIGGAGDQAAAGKVRAADLVMTTSQGRLILPAAAPGSDGAEVLLEVTGYPLRGAERRDALLQSHETFIRLAREWSSLKEAAAMVRLTGPEAPASPLLSAIPTPGPALASAILFFLSALKGGDLRGWLGDAAAKVLEETPDGHLSSRLADDFAQLGRLASHPQPSGWQVMLVPIARHDIVEQLRLFYRHKPGQGEREADAAGRFIVEAELKRFGVVQLDGLVKPKQFDLALRSDVPLTPDMQKHVRGIFASALEIGGLSGAMRFETPSTASVDPFHQEAGDGSHGSDVIV